MGVEPNVHVLFFELNLLPKYSYFNTMIQDGGHNSMSSKFSYKESHNNMLQRDQNSHKSTGDTNFSRMNWLNTRDKLS
jgi:hypothetical protein